MKSSLLFYITNSVLLVWGDYELQVTVNSFSNSEGRCADVGCTGCCEGGCPSTSCDYYFSHCLRPAGSAVSYDRNIYRGQCTASETPSRRISNSFGDITTEFYSTFSTLNPITHSVETLPSAGIQLFMEIIDEDSTNEHELIDRFVVNISDPQIGSTERERYTGIFGYAEVDLSIRVICADNFYGPNCDMFCVENCACPPGFTGEFCATSIDDCVGVECGENQRCVDAHLNYTCVCEAGYTGPDCLTDVDECEGVNCNSGTCVQGLGFFRCECPPRYSGQFCEMQLDTYLFLVTIHSFDNPGRACANCGGSGCCEVFMCDLACDYYFSLCQHPAGSHFSSTLSRTCFSLTTLSYEVSASRQSFGGTVFGIPNPLALGGMDPWPPEGMQLYIEILDDDYLGSPDELIDRFVVDISSPFSNATSSAKTYSGIFGMAEITMSISVACMPEYTGKFCETFQSAASLDDTTLPENASTTISTLELTAKTILPESTTADSGTVTPVIAALVVLVVVLLMVVVVITVAFSMALYLNTRKSKKDLEATQHPVAYSRSQVPPTDTADPNYAQINDTTEPNYDFPSVLTESQRSDTTLIRAAVPTAENEIGTLQRCPAYVFSSSEKNNPEDSDI